MLTRRHVRETAIQLIYSTEFNGCGDTAEARSAFWELVQENDRLTLQAAQLKALHHLASGREQRHTLLEAKSATAMPHLAGIPETEELRLALEKSLQDEKKWHSLHEKARILQKSSTESDQKKLGAALEELLVLDAAISSRRQQISHLMEDLPGFVKRLEGVTSALTKLQRISDRIQLLAKPEGYANDPQVSHLKTVHEDIISLRSEVEKMTLGCAQHTEDIDAKIAEVVENFSPSRINPVDRCVLRLALYEILYCDDIPTAVAINEALDIVRAFSGEDSHRFVNGILDKIAKAAS